MIAATALQYGLTIITRDSADFARARVTVFNPWVDGDPPQGKAPGG